MHIRDAQEIRLQTILAMPWMTIFEWKWYISGSWYPSMDVFHFHVMVVRYALAMNEVPSGVC